MTDETIFWYQLDPTGRSEVAASYRGAPLATLNLNVRTTNLLRRYNPRLDVAALLLADESIREVYQLGVGALAQINERMLALLDGHVPLEIYTPPPAATTDREESVAEPTRLLPETIAGQPVDLMGLSKRSTNAINKHGITSIGQLQRMPPRELLAIPGMGQTAVTEVLERIAAMFAFVQEDGGFDWRSFSQAQDVRLLPDPPLPLDAPVDLVRALPVVVEQVLLVEKGERYWHIVQRRFGLGGVSKRTLEELGQAFDLTRERVRQLTNKAIDTLSAALLQPNDAGRSYWVDPQLLAMLDGVLDRIRTLAAPGILQSNMYTILLEEFGLTAQQFDAIDDLLFAFAGLDHLQPRSSLLEPIVYIKSIPFEFDVEFAVRAMHDVLARRAAGLLEVDLLIEVNKHFKKGSRLNLEQLRTAVRLCSTAEMMADKTIRCRFAYLATRAEQIERILLEQGKPLAIADIVRSMNHLLAQTEDKSVTERNISNLMGADPRFAPIGRSGEWKLATWDHETAPILALMRQYLVLRNEPASAAEITHYVQALRTASEASVASYLNFDKSFVEIMPGRWGLAEWREARSAQRWDREQVAQFVAGFFKERRAKQVEYAQLKQALMDVSGLPAKQVQGLLATNPAVETHMVDGQRIALFQADYKQKLAAGPRAIQRKDKTLLQRIAEEVRRALEQAPNHEVGQAEMIDMLIAKHAVKQKRPYNMFHSYVARLDFVERFTPEGSKKVWLRLKQ